MEHFYIYKVYFNPAGNPVELKINHENTDY